MTENRFSLFIGAGLAHKHGMANQTGPAMPNGSWWRWAITPPQSYLIYLACLVVIFVGSFYAGTLKPKKPTGLGPSPVSAPFVPRT